MSNRLLLHNSFGIVLVLVTKLLNSHIICNISSSPFQTDMTSSTLRIEPAFTWPNYYLLTYLTTYLHTYLPTS